MENAKIVNEKATANLRAIDEDKAKLDADRLLVEQESAAVEEKRLGLSKAISDKESREKELSELRADLSKTKAALDKASQENVGLQGQAKETSQQLEAAKKELKADRKRQVKLLSAWSKEAIEALSRSGGNKLPMPSPTEADVGKAYVDFLKMVVDEIRLTPRRLNNALDAGCVGAMRAVGTDIFYNLQQVAPTLDFKALAALVSPGPKKDLSKKITDTVDHLVALRPGVPGAQPKNAPSMSKPAGGSGKGPVPPAGSPPKKGVPPPASK